MYVRVFKMRTCNTHKHTPVVNDGAVWPHAGDGGKTETDEILLLTGKREKKVEYLWLQNLQEQKMLILIAINVSDKMEGSLLYEGCEEVQVTCAALRPYPQPISRSPPLSESGEKQQGINQRAHAPE